MSDLVWYVAYGSNLGAARLQQYLDRGRDAAPPRADRGLVLDHGLWFGGESQVWTGGRAYVDHVVDEGAGTLARGWLLTREQWADLHALESGRDVDERIDPAGVASGESLPVGDGRYDVLIGLGVHDGVPAVTFTGPSPYVTGSATRPSADYLRAIAAGLREAHGFGLADAVDYLLARPGADLWTRAELAAALESTD